jgi:hypothetical protein
LIFVEIHVDHAHLDAVAGAHGFARILNEAIRKLRDMHEPVLMHANVDAGS